MPMFSFLNNVPNTFRRASVSFSPQALQEEEISPFKRLASRFQIQNRPQQNAPSITNDVSDPYAEYEEPQSPISSMFTKFLASAPRPEDYKASGMRRFGAALAGFGAGMRDPATGVAIADRINRQPYDTAVEAYNSEGAILEQMAKLEALGQKNSLEYRKLHQEWLNTQADNTREDRKVNLTEEGNRLDKEKFDYTKTKDQRDLEFKYDELTGKGWKESYDDKGNLIMVNPLDFRGTINFGPSFKRRELDVNDFEAKSGRINANAATQNAQSNSISAMADASRAQTYSETAGAGQEARDTNARANETRANTYRDYTNFLINRPTPIKMQEQLLAQVAAARELVTSKPEYAQFWDDAANSIKDTTWFGADRAKYNQFLQDLESATMKKLMQTYPNPNQRDDDAIDLGDIDVAPPTSTRRPGGR